MNDGAEVKDVTEKGKEKGMNKGRKGRKVMDVFVLFGGDSIN